MTSRPSGPILREEDLEERFVHASGPGGQNVNKVATRVILRHVPTGITITVQDSRSQARNREIARERLLEALKLRRERAAAEARHQRELRRRRNAPRPPGVKRRILADKRRRSDLKRSRGNVQPDP